MSTIINADTSDGLKFTSDTSGEIKLQSAGTDIATVSSSGITMASGKGLAATGHVLQVVNATYSTTVTHTSNTFIDTGLTASITPTSSNSKILVLVNQSGVGKESADTRINFKILRGATSISEFSKFTAQNNTSAYNNVGSVSVCYLDSPATTSSTTYKTQFENTDNAGTVFVQSANCMSTITLMEIAG